MAYVDLTGMAVILSERIKPVVHPVVCRDIPFVSAVLRSSDEEGQLTSERRSRPLPH